MLDRFEAAGLPLIGAAGVDIARIRLAAGAVRAGRGGHVAEAGPLLASPPATAVRRQNWRAP